MSLLRLACIVEGHGEEEGLKVLLERLILQCCEDRTPVVGRPIRRTRASLINSNGELERWVSAAAIETRYQGGVIVVLDADDDLPCELGPRLLTRAESASRGCPVSVVVAKREFEAWFLAAAQSIAGRFGLPVDLQPPDYPEEIRGAKEWLARRTPPEDRYRPTLHQADYAGVFDIVLARRNSASFDKLCREVERLCREVTIRFGEVW